MLRKIFLYLGLGELPPVKIDRTDLDGPMVLVLGSFMYSVYQLFDKSHAHQPERMQKVLIGLLNALP